MFVGRQVEQNADKEVQQYMNNDVDDIYTLTIVLYLA